MNAETPTPNAAQRLFVQFLQEYFDGSHVRAAEALGVDRSLVSYIVRGQRSITPALALKVEILSAGRFPKEPLTWPDVYPTAVVPPRVSVA